MTCRLVHPSYLGESISSFSGFGGCFHLNYIFHRNSIKQIVLTERLNWVCTVFVITLKGIWSVRVNKIYRAKHWKSCLLRLVMKTTFLFDYKGKRYLFTLRRQQSRLVFSNAIFSRDKQEDGSLTNCASIACYCAAISHYPLFLKVHSFPLMSKIDNEYLRFMHVCEQSSSTAPQRIQIRQRIIQDTWDEVYIHEHVPK